MSYSFAVVGTGAVGGYYGGLLARAGADIQFLCHSDAEFVRKNGLFVETPRGDFRIPGDRAFSNVHDMSPVDIVLCALKSTRNRDVGELVKPILKPDGMLVVLQNGLNNEEDLAAQLPGIHLVGGLCFICSNKVGPGHIKHLDYGMLALGEYAPGWKPVGINDRLKLLQNSFVNAGVEAVVFPDLRFARWKKLVWNIPYNGLSVVLNATTDELMGNPLTRSLIEEIMLEVISIARAEGKEIEPAFVEKMLSDTAKMIPYRTSMKIDYDEGREMEIEAIFGGVVRAASSLDVPIPRIAMLYAQLSLIQASSAMSRLNRA